MMSAGVTLLLFALLAFGMPVAFALVVSGSIGLVLIGATWAHAGNGWLFTSPNGGWEYPAFLTVGVIVQVADEGRRLAGEPRDPRDPLRVLGHERRGVPPRLLPLGEPGGDAVRRTTRR